MTVEIRKVWRVLRPLVKDGCTFAEIKDLVASAALPVEELSHLQQKSLPARGASKSELLDAVDELISRDPDPEAAVGRMIKAFLDARAWLHDQASEAVRSLGLRIEGGRLVGDAGASASQALVLPATPVLQDQSPTSIPSGLDIFISHSSRDADVAEVLIELIRAALGIPAERIRCTSVDGYRLPVGVSTDEQLQLEVRNSQCFIALLTSSSLQSPYVLFELGARWGARMRFMPLLCKGLDTGALKAPLASLNALSCASGAQLHQLLSDIGQVLGKTPAPPAAYEKYIQRLQAFKPDAPASDRAPVGSPSARREAQQVEAIGPEGRELLALVEQEPDVEQRGVVEILKEFTPGQIAYFPRLQYGGNPLTMKSRLFKEAVRQLVSANRLYPPEHNPSRNTRTYEYRP